MLFTEVVHCSCFCPAASDVASFDGSSSLVFRLSIRPRTAVQIIALKFKTLKNSGTLLHAEGERDHSLNLVLEKGKLLLYHQQGATLASQLHWAENKNNQKYSFNSHNSKINKKLQDIGDDYCMHSSKVTHSALKQENIS